MFRGNPRDPHPPGRVMPPTANAYCSEVTFAAHLRQRDLVQARLGVRHPSVYAVFQTRYVAFASYLLFRLLFQNNARSPFHANPRVESVLRFRHRERQFPTVATSPTLCHPR